MRFSRIKDCSVCDETLFNVLYKREKVVGYFKIHAPFGKKHFRCDNFVRLELISMNIVLYVSETVIDYVELS